MTILMGPILSLRETDAEKWTVSALVIVDKKSDYLSGCTYNGLESPAPTELMCHDGEAVLRYDMTVPRGEEPAEVSYAIGGKTSMFTVPAIGSSPKIAFVSCNGFSDPKAMKNVDDKNALWNHLDALGRESGIAYNVLIMGGDQVYADQIWSTPDLKIWSDLSRNKRRAHAFTASMKGQVNEFYFTLYKERWSQPEVAGVLAKIPTVMTWDDHDIFDGWGSYSTEDQGCPVYKGIFAVAKNHFAVFQQHLETGSSKRRPSALPAQPGFTFALEIDGVAVLALDTRSERSQGQVMSPESWNAVWKWTESLGKGTDGGPRHLLVVSPVPVVHADFGSIESIMNWMPGEQELEDDLRDHWQSEPHRKERLRMVHRLFSLMDNAGIRVTILSGDVHCAGLGVLETARSNNFGSRACVINQLTSSGVVHPAPPKIMGYLLEGLASEREEVDQGISAYMLNFPAKRKKFVLARNFLSLEPDEDGRLWANWYIENDLKEPSVKVINPII